MMRAELQPLSRIDMARYPFTLEASEYVSSRGGISLSELERLPQLLEAAATRIETALQGSVILDGPDEDVAILSFPAAILLLATISNDIISQKYAWGEGKTVERLMLREPSWKLVRVARRTMGWEVEGSAVAVGDCVYEYQIAFASYLKAIPHPVAEPDLKLVNKVVSGGRVLLTKAEMASLVGEGIRERILEKVLDAPRHPQQLPQAIVARADELRRRLIRSKTMLRHPDAFPRGILWLATPPCIRELRRAAVEAKPMSKAGLFAFGTFLVELGSPKKEVEKFFSNFAPDGLESVNAIMRGTYTVPSCETLKRHGVCYRPDSLCRKIDRPSVYYKRKLEARPAPASKARRPPPP